ncbi:MAG TPA: DUF1576 domain-containing protein [bacterium]|nr:DUF1576 domain-containing protein [bacterium]
MVKQKSMILLLFLPVLLIFTSFFLATPDQILNGISRIVVSPSLLLTDYLLVGGLGATLLNAGLCGFAAVLMMLICRVDVNGPFIAAVYTVTGFAFFGKNIFNIWPVLAGVYLFSLYQKAPYRNNLLVALFGTTLAPLVSYFSFGAGLSPASGIATGILFGLASGFILPAMASHMLRFHNGYNIYNVGFTGGIIGSFIVANARSFGFEINPSYMLAEEFDLFFRIFLSFVFLFLMCAGFFFSRSGTQGLMQPLKRIHRSTGRLISDFTIVGGYPATFFNMGFMGMVSMLFVFLVGGSINGPVIGGILTVVGFSAFGKHVRNCLPILLGVVIASFMKIWETSATEVIIAGLFGTTLAPVAGQYGFAAGIAAGFFHLSIVMNVGLLHGGINLYNNGFAGGFVAAFLVPVIDFIKRHGENDEVRN